MSDETLLLLAADWLQPDPGAYDPDSPLGLLKSAASRGDEDERTQATVWAVRSMAAAGARKSVLSTVARVFAKREGLMSMAAYDDLVADALAEFASTADAAVPADDERGPSVATQLVQIAQDLFTFGISDLGEPFALPKDGPKVVSMLRGSKTSLRALLAREYFSRSGRAATQQALADSLLVLEGVAQEADPEVLHLRAARHGRSLWLDLGDHTGRAVEVTAEGWKVREAPPVLFRRTSLTGALPEPEHGGEVARLWEWLNVSKVDRPLILAALVHALFSDEPHVVLAILGEHGTAKTTATKVLVGLLDPGPVPVRKPPRDAEAWVTAASGSWMVALDNLSVIPPWLSDAMCRASTGDGDVRRKLYTDADYAVFAFRRCLLFNSIDVGALAPDLADRAVPITLDIIPDEDRKSERAFWQEWPDAHPKLLGAVLDLASTVLAKPAHLEKAPRMADFADVLAAVDAELGTDALARYSRQSAALAADSLSSDQFAMRIQEVIAAHFEGTSAELLERLTPADPEWKRPKDWPVKPRQVTSWLRRYAPALRKTGWRVEDLGSENHAKLLRWSISPPAQPEIAGDDTRQSPHDPQDAGIAGIGGHRAGQSQADCPERLCSRCGEQPPGPGGIICRACATSLKGESEISGDDTRRSTHDPQECAACGADEDSILHAVGCLGRGDGGRGEDSAA